MPPTVHKILIQGSSIVKEAILPIGQLSEEALEARYKNIRRYREHHTRKISRMNTNEDLFKRLLLTFDPLISSLQKFSKKQVEIATDVKNLLINDEKSTENNNENNEIFYSERI